MSSLPAVIIRFSSGLSATVDQGQQPEENETPQNDTGRNRRGPKRPDSRSAIKVIANPTSHRESSNTNHDVKNGISSGVVSGFSAGSHIRVMVYTRPSSSNRPTRRVDCNRSAAVRGMVRLRHTQRLEAGANGRACPKQN